MTPTTQQTTQPVIIARLDILSQQLTDLDAKIDCMVKEQSAFMIAYTRGHAELEAKVNKVDEKADRAHTRIDAINKMVWAIALPVILGALAFLWAVATNTVTIGAP